MQMTQTIRRATFFAVCYLVCTAFGAPTDIAKVLDRAHSKPPVKTRLILRVGDTDKVDIRHVTLFGRDDDVLLAQDTRTGTGLTRIQKTQVIRCEFDLEYDRSAVATALQAQDWAAAVRNLSPVVQLALPYLDITDNNGLEMAMDLGMYMVASADREILVTPKTEANRERALKQYAAAAKLFNQAAKADWTPVGQVARLKECLALLAQGKEEPAKEIFDETASPSPGDTQYGHYWLVQAELLNHAGKTVEALDASVKSVVFANKDVQTFPTSILLTAECYAKLGQYHRARDLYYEVAVLFVGTDWAADALVGLASVMEDGKTLVEEKAPIENVFFNVSDDMNKLSEELLKAQSKPKEGEETAKKDL